MVHNLIDLSGKTFGRLIVISRSGSSKDGRAVWLCRCVCGSEKIIIGKELRLGRTRSCGCLIKETSLENCRRMRERQKLGEISYGNFRHGEGQKGRQSHRFLLYYAAKARARKYEVPFSLSITDIPDIPKTCPILGIPLHRGRGEILPNSPSLDRIIPELGYVVGNIRIISYRANHLKSNATIAELEDILTDAKSLKPFVGVPAVVNGKKYVHQSYGG
jgi:hypothetical protein